MKGVKTKLPKKKRQYTITNCMPVSFWEAFLPVCNYSVPS